ncbi:MAG TPA: hypothetical protein VL024_11075 [Castellaniella sp.]|nr:hypothetical protein [Castellaniella sp.]
MSDSEEVRGFAQFTEGKFVTWIGKGKTEIVANSDFQLAYGTKTGIFLGTTYDFTLGAKQSLFMGATFDAKHGAGFEILKNKVLRVAGEGGFHYIDHHFASVGTDMQQKLLMERVRYAAWILIGTQTAVITACAAPALIWKIADSAGKKLGYTKVPDAIGIAAIIANAVMGLGVMLGILAMRYKSFGSTGKPVGMLSLHRASKGSVFLGRRDSLGGSAGGVSMDKTGIELSTAKADLEYKKPANSTAVIGFENDAEDKGGSRLRLNAQGAIQAWGKSLYYDVDGKAIQKAKVHKLKTLDDQGDSTKTKLRLKENDVLLQATDDTGMFITKNAGFGALADQAFMNLIPIKASIGRGGNELTLDGTAVKLAFGGTAITIDASGINLGGGAVTIMAPGGGSATADELVQMKQQLAKLQSLDSSEDSQVKADNKKLKLEEDSVSLQDSSLISVSSVVSGDE